MQPRAVSSQARLNVIPIWGHDWVVECKRECKRASRTINVCGCVVWPKWMKVWKGNKVECEAAQHALFFKIPNGWVGRSCTEPSSYVLRNRSRNTLNVVSEWCSCFSSKKANLAGETAMMSVIVGNASEQFGYEGMHPVIKSGEIRGKTQDHKMIFIFSTCKLLLYMYLTVN